MRLPAQTEKNYILPFFWMKGETPEVIQKEMEKVAECGIGAVCVESRPHPDFCGERWWRDLDIIMEEARRRDMKVWVLDDKKFPTGYANGWFESKFPEKSKLYLAERHMDIMGPCENAAVLVKPFLPEDATLLGIYAYPRKDADSFALSMDEAVDLTDSFVENGFVYFTLPQGIYRLFVLFTTQTGGGRAHYMNLIDSESVKVLLEAVYEPHYERYRKDFGKTFAGFFSDEPELGNTPGYDFHNTLGQADTKLPWSCQLAEKLKERWGDAYVKNMVALWYETGRNTDVIRYEYMDSMTKLVSDCFAGQIGAWCQERGVEYIGHIIEDDNAHTNLNCSIGHYFREQAGQHMAGIDVVHFQILPGFHGKVHRWLSWETDGEFFHFGLAKLGSSMAHIDPKKKGRAICEIFGNFGWAEGIATMKWLTDHMLVRGINHFVPHAFSPADFPDRDCPPHFYAHGNNPQYKYFQSLMKYMNRMAALLSGGCFHTDAAVLYHGESVWAGKTMLYQKLVRALLENQLDCDVIPADVLCAESASVRGGQMEINGQRYAGLVIPECEAIPSKAAAYLAEAAEKGLAVYFAGGRPVRTCEGTALPAGFETCGTVTELSALAQEIRKSGTPAIEIEGRYPELRFCCVHRGRQNVYMFFNESVVKPVSAEVKILSGTWQSIGRYDAVNDVLFPEKLTDNRFVLRLAPGESTVILLDTEKTDKEPQTLVREVSVLTDWAVSKSETKAYPQFVPVCKVSAGEMLPNLNAPEYCPEFTGYFQYEGHFAAKPGERVMLYLPQISDAGEVTVNGQYAGTVLGGNGRVNVTDLLTGGDNTLRIETANTLVWMVKDGASAHLQVPATGLGKPPVLEYYQSK